MRYQLHGMLLTFSEWRSNGHLLRLISQRVRPLEQPMHRPDSFSLSLLFSYYRRALKQSIMSMVLPFFQVSMYSSWRSLESWPVCLLASWVSCISSSSEGFGWLKILFQCLDLKPHSRCLTLQRMSILVLPKQPRRVCKPLGCGPFSRWVSCSSSIIHCSGRMA